MLLDNWLVSGWSQDFISNLSLNFIFSNYNKAPLLTGDSICERENRSSGKSPPPSGQLLAKA